MNARRVSRELIIMVLSQIKLDAKKINIDEILLNSVRTLIGDAKDDLETTTATLIDIKDYLQNYEIDSDENKNRPLHECLHPFLWWYKSGKNMQEILYRNKSSV